MASPDNEPNGSGSMATETTSLLATPAAEGQSEGQDADSQASKSTHDGEHAEDEKPYPMMQIAVLCYARLLEPMAFFSIFSFINEMVWATGNVPEEDVGFYSGLIESLFSLTQMAVLLPWGRAADRFGRKPTLVISLIGVTIAQTLFGFSQTIWQMVLFRSLAGVFAGTLVTLQTMLAENTTPTTQARAFSFLSFMSNLGILLGPFIGGVLCNPADQYPGLFGDVKFLKDFPYALPTIVIGAIGLTTVASTSLFAKETLKTKSVGEAAPPTPMSTLEVVRSPGVLPVLCIYANIFFLAYSYTAIIPLYCFTEVGMGGLGFSPLQISGVLGVTGLSQTLYTLLIFPPLQHRVGTVGILRGAAVAWPLFFMVGPVCNLLLRHGFTVAFWVIGPTCLVLGSGVAMAFTAVQLAINDIAPTNLTLGTLNAAALFLGSGIRAISPGLFGSIYAIGVRGQILGGHLVFLILVLLGVALNIAVRWLPEKAYGRLARKTTANGETP